LNQLAAVKVGLAAVKVLGGLAAVKVLVGDGERRAVGDGERRAPVMEEEEENCHALLL
jgi:hypothetical protein